MKIIYFILSLFLFNFCFSQKRTDSICNLKSDNSQWQRNFENAQNNAERISLIKQKVFSDSIYKDYNASFKTHDVISSATDKFGNDCGCKIFFHLNYLTTEALVLNLSQNPKIKPILNNLDFSNIDEIIPLFDSRAESLYGTFGKCGAVILKTKDKRLIKLIKKISK